MTQLIDPHNKTPREIRTHTHTHTPRLPPRSDHPSYLWDTWLSFLFLGSTNQSSRLKNRTFILCLLWSCFCRGWGCPSGWRGWGLVPLFIGSLCWPWHFTNQWLSLLRPGSQTSDLQYPTWQGWAFKAFCPFNREDCLRRCLSESGHLTFTVCEKWHVHTQYFRPGIFLFLSILRSKIG